MALEVSRTREGGPRWRLGRVFSLAVKRLVIWFERDRQRRALAALDDRLLADAGISRAQAAEECAKPFWR